MALLPGAVYVASSVALTPSIVLLLQREELVDIASQHAPLMRCIVSWLARRIVSSQCFTPQRNRTSTTRAKPNKPMNPIKPTSAPQINRSISLSAGEDRQEEGEDVDRTMDRTVGLRQRHLSGL
jgi:CRP-like cAMP-binding protein